MAIIDRYDGLLIDIDGVVRVGNEFLPDARDAITELEARGLPYAFVTNSPRLTPAEHAEELRAAGVPVPDGGVVTAAETLISFILDLTGAGIGAVVVGTDSFRRQVAEAGIEEVALDRWQDATAVMVSGHERFDYGELKAAAMAARAGAVLAATGSDPTMPMPDGHWPGTGSILAAIETASGAQATVTGKPFPAIFEAGLEAIGRPGKVAMVGDRSDTDVAGAQAVGLDGILVSRPESASAQPGVEWVDPDHRIGSLLDLFS